jgi:hypothetical protein
VDVVNTGSRRGTDVAQLYLGLPQPRPGVVQPPRQLKGFRRVTLGPGRHRRVTFRVNTRSLSYWDTAAGDWRVAPGCYGVKVGRSSRSLARGGTLALRGASCGRRAVRVPGHCRKRVTLTIRIKGVRRSRVRRVAVFVSGHRRRVLRGPRSRVRVRVKRGARVRLVIRTRKHRRLVMKRRARRCTQAH